jgi:small-conductance mechanosensitive channel
MAIINGNFIGDVSFHSFLLFLFVIVLTFILGGFLNILVIKLLKEKTKPVVYKTLSKIVMYSVYVSGFYLAFNKIINFSLPAGLAALGVLGIALLLPMVPVLQNIASGVVLAFERPFKEEDIIEINGELCKVKDIMLRKTRLRSLDGKIIIISNLSFIAGLPVINYSAGEFIKISLNIEVASDTDNNKVVKILEKICYNSPNILPNVPEKKLDTIAKILSVPKNFFTVPRNIKNLKPVVNIKNVNKDKISLELSFWIWDILLKESIISSFYQKLIEEFKRENIKLG